MGKGAKESGGGVLASRRIVLPLLISLAVAFVIFYFSFDLDTFRNIRWTQQSTMWLLLGMCCMAARFGLYAYRLRVATSGKIKWRHSIQDIIIWDFASAVTPSTVGGASVAMFILSKERISLGESASVVMLVSFLDNLFYVISVPIIMFILGTELMFPDVESCNRANNLNRIIQWADNLWILFLIGYGFFLVLTSLLAYGLFINPMFPRKLFDKVFSWRILRRWKSAAEKTGDDILSSSKFFKQQKLGFWFKLGMSTILAWTARFFIAVCVIMAFTGSADTAIVYARQFVLWIVTLVPTSPGASGVAEFAFIGMLCEYIPAGLEGIISQGWRLMTYYFWVLGGAIVLPIWVNRVFKKKQKA